MSRRANIEKRVHLHVTLPEEIHAQLSLFLFSEAEQRIPVGAYQRFIVDRTREFFSGETRVNADDGLLIASILLDWTETCVQEETNEQEFLHVLALVNRLKGALNVNSKS